MSITVNLAWQNIDASIDAESGNDFATAVSEVYIVSGTTDDFEAIRAAYNSAPSSKEGLTKSKASIEERATEDTWKVRVDYSSNVLTSLGGENGEQEYSYSFSTGGGTQHVETPLLNVANKWDTSVYPNGREYPGCIEPDSEGNPRGVDIPAPVFKFSETHKFSASKVTTAFKCKLAYATRCMNSRPFRGYKAGEVLFMGVSGTQSGTTENAVWSLTYVFAVQPNQTNIVIGDITGPTKFGWDYLWKNIESRTGESGKIYKKVTGVFVHRLYTPIDFSVLGI